MRQRNIDKLHESFDAVIVGGGISGAGVYDKLCREGYRVLLIDKGDFASGTSQASGMMIWGGLLYLQHCDFRTVIKLSKARDELVKDLRGKIEAKKFRYLPLKKGGRSRALVHSGLYLYWLMSMGRRQRPYSTSQFPERSLIQQDRFKKSLVYEEAGLEISDCRFILEWIARYQGEHCSALNYVSLQKAHYDKDWHLELLDEHSGSNYQVKSKLLINATGVWAEQVDGLCGIDSPYKHVFSKGVYLAFKRPENHHDCMVFETGQHGDCQTFHPWGPVSLWGPTETSIKDLSQGFQVTTEDIRHLLGQANQNLSMNYDAGDIVSLRCGVRPLAVKKSYQGDHYPLSLSRKHLVHHEKTKGYISIYGGKLTACRQLGIDAHQQVKSALREGRHSAPEIVSPRYDLDAFHSPDPSWSVANEFCLTFEDFIRRRSNISQWVKRGGLGEQGGCQKNLLEISRVIEKENYLDALKNYQSKISLQHDQLLQEV